MTTIGFATLQIIPSLRGVSDAIRKQMRDLKINANVDVTGAREAGARAGRGIRQGIDSSRFASGLHQQVDQELSAGNAQRTGRRFGAALGGAIMSSVKGAIKGLPGLFSSLGSINAGKLLLVGANLDSIALGTKVASHAARGLSVALLATSVAAARISGAALGGLAVALRVVSRLAGGVSRDIARITSSLLVLAAAARGLNTLGRLGGIAGKGVIGFSALLGVVTGVSALIGGPLVAALTAAAAAMAAAAGAAAGILGPALAAVKIGISGLGDGAKAYEASQKAGASTAKAAASAAKQVQQAEKDVERAKRDARAAEVDLTRARKDAAEQLEDMNLQLRGAALSEKDAQLSLLEAHRDLQNLGRDGQPVDMIDRERAVLRVQEAEQRLAETQESNGDLAEKAADANRAGVEGSDQVVAAKQRVADANQAVLDAEERVAEARKAAAEAESGGAGVDPFDAMIGQRMAPLLDSVKNLKHAVTDQFSQSLLPGFSTLGGLLDGLSPKLSGLAGLFGTIGSDVATSLSGPIARKGFDDMFAASNQFFSAFKGESGLGGLSSGLIAFAGTAGKAIAGVGGGINATLKGWGDTLAKITPEMITAGFQQLRQVITNIGNVVGPIISALRQLGGISAPALAPGFKAIGDAIAQATPGLMNIARTLMPALGQAMANLAPLLPGLVDAFTPWSMLVAAIVPHIATLISHLGPMAPLILGVALAAKAITVAMIAYNSVMAIASVAQGVHAAATGAGTAALGTNTIALAAHRVAMLAGAAATGIASAATTAFGVALKIAMGPVGLVIAGIAALAAGLVYAYNHSDTFRKVVDATWQGIKVAAQATVDWFVNTAWPWLKKAWDSIADAAMWLWHNVIEPVWGGIKAVIGLAWEVVGDIFNNWIRVGKLVGEGAMWLWQNAIQPAWDGIKSAISVVWDAVSPIFDKFVAGWDRLKGAVSPVGTAIKDAFSGVTELIKEPLRALGTFLAAIPSDVFGFAVPGADTLNSWGKSLKSLSTGGYTGDLPIDQIAGVVHGGEHVIKAASTARIENAYPGLLDYLNNTGKLPGYSEGGRVSAAGLVQFAKGVEGKPYDWGGVNWGDCSGAVSAIANYATGRDPFGSRFATGTEGAELAARGFKSGLGPAGSLNVGWFNGGPYGGHTAATLPNGVHFEMGGNRGNGQYGGGAAGAEDRQFTDHAHLPKEYFTGLDAGAPTTNIGSGVGGSALQSITDSGALMAEAGTGAGSSAKGSVPSSITGLSTWGIDALSSGRKSEAGNRDPLAPEYFPKAASAAVSGQVGSLLGVFGVPDSPGWLDGIGKFVGGISVSSPAGASGLGSNVGGGSHAGTGAAPGPLDEQNRLLYDDGGWLPEGLSLTENKTGGPEAILTQNMWNVARDGVDIAMKMAKGFAGAGGIKPLQQPTPPPVTYNIQARDTEDAFIRAQRQERERAAAKLERF